MSDSPVAILFNTSGTELAVSASQPVSAAQPTIVVVGSASNGTYQYFKMATDGTLFVTGTLTTTTDTSVTSSVYIGGFSPTVTASILEVGPAGSSVSGTNAVDGLVGYTLLSANSNRKGAIFYLDGNRIAYLKLGTGADTNSFSLKLTNFGYYELPYRYTGPITVSFNSGSNSATLMTTELS